MPRKRQAKQEDDMPDERVTRLRTRRPAAPSKPPQGETEEHAQTIKIIPVFEKAGRTMDRAMEENLLAYVDIFEAPCDLTKSSSDRTLGSRLPFSARIQRRDDKRTESSNLQQGMEEMVDCKLTFLEGVIDHAYFTVPARRIHAAVFKCLKEATSHGVATRSFHLLTQLEKKFPRMQFKAGQLFLNSKVWAPFEDLDAEDNYRDKASKANRIAGDSSQHAVMKTFLSDQISYEHVNWHEFVSKLAQFLQTSPGRVPLADSLVFQYLVDLLENDLNLRMRYFEANNDIDVIQCSYFRKLLKGSDRAAAKDMFRNLQRMLCASVKCDGEGTMAQLPCGQSVGGGKEIFYSAEKLIIMFTKLGICEKNVQRSNLWDIVQEFPDDTQFLEVFLQALSQPKHKMDVITMQLHKNLTAKNLRSKHNHTEFADIVKCLAEEEQALKICRAFKPDALEVLLGHGFQAYCLLWRPMGVYVTTSDFCRSFKDALLMHQMIENRRMDEVHIVARSALALAEMHCSQ